MTVIEAAIKQLNTGLYKPAVIFLRGNDWKKFSKELQTKRMIRRLRGASKIYYSQPLWLRLVDSDGNVTDNRLLLKHTTVGKIEMVYPFTL